ncbi:MAG: hypothetical protein GX417_04225, partial [Clostridiales bacterium]|nr:hypothetical protein [Clostridiales bacterium]
FHLVGQREEIGLIAPNLVDIREISTDIDVTDMDFTLVVKTPFQPVAANATPTP